jgi:Uma2 family endonuclease
MNPDVSVQSMSPILDEPAVRAAAFRITVPFYHEMGRLGLVDRSVELLDGVIVRKMSKSPLHMFVLQRLQRLLLAAASSGQLVRTEGPITVGSSEPEPDLAVVEGNESDFAERHPSSALLVVEVAIYSVDLDRRKAAIYASADVAEYWLVEPECARVTVHRLPAGGAYQSVTVLADRDSLACEAIPSLRVVVSELFRR